MKKLLLILLLVNRLVLAQGLGITNSGALAATAMSGPHFITVSWSASTTPNVTYAVGRSLTSGTEVIISSGIIGTTYNDTTAISGTHYFYVAIVCGKIALTNCNIQSNETSATAI